MSRLFSKRNRVLLKELVITDFKLRYQGSALGYLWSLLKPLMLFFIMYMVFVRFLRFGADVPHFAVSLLMGVVCWNFFTEATLMGMTAIVSRGDLIRKINFPKYIIVISATISALINFAINMVVVLIFAAINGVQFRLSVLLVPLNIIELYILAVALAFLLGGIYVKYRDVGHIWEVLMQGMFYATPIIYPLSMVSENFGNIAKGLLLSPIAQIIQDIRYNLISDQTETVWNYIHTWYIQAIPLLIVVILIIFASSYFRRNSRKFAEVM